MFNIADIIVALLILFAIFRGYKKGFIKTGFGVLSFFIAIFITFMFYKPVMNIIKEKTGFEEWLSQYLYSMDLGENDNSNLESGDMENTLGNGNKINDDTLNGETMVNTDDETNYIDNLPETIVGMLGLEEIKENAKITIVEKIVEFAVKLLAIIIVYIGAKIVLAIVVVVLDSIAKLPVLKQFNEVLGLILGGILGVLQIYTICAVTTLVGSLPAMEGVLEVINSSMFAGSFYNNNLLLEILF